MPLVERDILSDHQIEATLEPSEDKPRAGHRAQSIELLRRVNTRDLCRLARQLSTLLHAGMPLVPALSALVEQMQCPTKSRAVRWGQSTSPLAHIVEQVRDSVNAGNSLAEAFGRSETGLFVELDHLVERDLDLEAVDLQADIAESG